MSTCSPISKCKDYRLSPHKRNHTYRNSYPRAVRQRKNQRQVLSSFILILLLLSTMSWFIWDWQNTMYKVDSLIYEPYVVQSGDTLWSLAAGSGTGIDTRTLVQKIMEYNQLTDSTIQTGQLIYTPTSP
ncbi:MAG: LysM peptidoglycan-binding domain-containing protein [Desulfitobacterium sp.]|nr:LysM peptidoglycan-binding domain-containing protein [Desulfitobacterium sp.]